MTDKEAMKMALEFIERVNKEGWILDDFEPEMYQVIAALKERLEDPMREMQRLGQEIEQEQQIETLKRCLFQMQEAAKDLVEQAKSLTQPQRTWVGLTDDEVKYEWVIWKASLPRYVGFAKGIEAKLRSKNQ